MRIRERFNPRAPCGARLPRLASLMQDGHISTHAPLAGRDLVRHAGPIVVDISTHAPLAGRDLVVAGIKIFRKDISTHAPLAGRDHSRDSNRHPCLDFNPRAPCGARRRRKEYRRLFRYFNPRAPCGARRMITG